MKLFILFLIFFSGCISSTSYVPANYSETLKPKELKDVQVFFSPSDVPYKFRTLGKIFVDISSREERTQKEQIDGIRETAAKNGADGVIISSSVVEVGPRLFRRPIDKFEGLAIAKE